MPVKQYLNYFKETLLPATLNSYSIIFFLNNKLFAAGILVITLFHFYSGISGLVAVLTSIVLASLLGFDRNLIRKGFFSFNSLLLGLGMGTFFDPGLVYFSLLLLAVLITLMLSVGLNGWFGKHGLPFLSIPFVIGFWLVVLPSSAFENLGLTQRNIYWINEAYSLGGSHLVNFLQAVDGLSINKLADTYFRSLSSVFFQNNILSGIVIAVLLLLASRISFTLSIIGYLSSYFFASFTGSDTVGFSYYNIGANYIMTALAIGGFFVIPSVRSYFWTFLLVPVACLVLLFLTKLCSGMHLPVFSLPFSVVVILFLYFLMMRKSDKGMVLTPIQHYTPETNLYTYSNNKTRLARLLYIPLHLPYWGEWIVSQGYNGKYTHKGDWSKALDFILLDEEMKSYSSPGQLCEQYHCYNKPVLAPADGIVEEIIDHINDNEIGNTNTVNNWGNTIVIRHVTGLYTQLSHLRKGSFRVAKGDSVKQGDIVATCGNSGRSHQPHLHFQVQTSPVAGAKTIEYPIAYWLKSENGKRILTSFSVPEEGEMISDVRTSKLLTSGFGIQPNQVLRFKCQGGLQDGQTVEWEAYTDAYNYKYLYCRQTDSYAYYVNDGTMFYFTSFYGNKKSLLYYFYLAAYKVLLGYYENLEITDELPLNTVLNRNGIIWLHDFIAPFSRKVRASYSILPAEADDAFHPQVLKLESRVWLSVYGKNRHESCSTIALSESRIERFTYENKKLKIEAICINI